MSPTAIIVLVIVVVVVIAASILVGQRGLTLEDATNRRLIEYAQREEEVTIADAELDVPFYERVVVPLLNAISKRIMQLTPEAQLESIRSKLDAAGMLQKTSPGAFLGKRLMYTVVLGLAGLAVLFVVPNLSTLYKLLIVILLPVAGYYLPMSQVNSQIKRRQQSIVRDLPDALGKNLHSPTPARDTAPRRGKVLSSPELSGRRPASRHRHGPPAGTCRPGR